MFKNILLNSYHLKTILKNWKKIKLIFYKISNNFFSNNCALLTFCSGTKSWLGCRSGWAWRPVPAGPGRWGISGARNSSPTSAAGGRWTPSGPCAAYGCTTTAMAAMTSAETKIWLRRRMRSFRRRPVHRDPLRRRLSLCCCRPRPNRCPCSALFVTRMDHQSGTSLLKA